MDRVQERRRWCVYHRKYHEGSNYAWLRGGASFASAEDIVNVCKTAKDELEEMGEVILDEDDVYRRIH